MILILIALVVVTIAGIVLAQMFYGTIAELGGIILSSLGGLGLLLYAGAAWEYIGAGYKMEIVNQEFKTNYTQTQIFFASDVIDEIRELKRQRVEINGNLMGGE